MTARASIDRVETAVVAAGGTFRQRGANLFRSIGVCHGGTRSESLVFIYDPERGRVNPYCHGGCSFDQILAALHISSSDRYDEPRGDRTPITPPPTAARKPDQPPVVLAPAPFGWAPPRDEWMPCGHRKTAEYDYRDEAGRLLFGVARCESKCFAQWRPAPDSRSGRRWRLTERDRSGREIATVRLVPFHLPELLTGVAAQRAVYVVEGEKDVLALERAGLVATCNSGGAGKWTQTHAAHLEHADVVIIADRDVPGRRHAEHVAATLANIADAVRIVIAAHGKDAADHLDAGGTPDTFVPVWTPKLKELAR